MCGIVGEGNARRACAPVQRYLVTAVTPTFITAVKLSL